MVQKKSDPSAAAKKRGRPRAFEPEAALSKALAQFRRTGFTATSLDDLTAATGMNKPSLYGAFGDKRALYIEAMKRYGIAAKEALAEVLATPRPLEKALRHAFAIAVQMYGGDGGVGCFNVLTSASEAISDPEIRDMVAKSLTDSDAAFAQIFQRAKQAGEIPKSANPQQLGAMASATLHTLSVRARTGADRKALEAVADHAVKVLTAAAKA